MAVVNLMEDLVYETTRRVISSNRDMGEMQTNIDDIVAYVLNRIPPRYTTSERGILHGVLETRLVFQQKSDILFLIHEAIHVVGEGRPSETTAVDEEKRLSLPHIIGEVLEESTFSYIKDINITLLYKGTPAKSYNDEWKNPYITNQGTRGYFHFWPDYVPGEMGGNIIEFSLLLEHPKFKSKKIIVEVDVVDHASMGKSFQIPIILMQLNEGEDISFLQE